LELLKARGPTPIFMDVGPHHDIIPPSKS
jgi:hypothetical protein